MEPYAGLEVDSDDDQAPLDPGEFDCEEPATVDCVRLHQPRVRLPGRGDHKPSFGAVGGSGAGPEGVEPSRQEGSFGLRFLL